MLSGGGGALGGQELVGALGKVDRMGLGQGVQLGEDRVHHRLGHLSGGRALQQLADLRGACGAQGAHHRAGDEQCGVPGLGQPVLGEYRQALRRGQGGDQALDAGPLRVAGSDAGGQVAPALVDGGQDRRDLTLVQRLLQPGEHLGSPGPGRALRGGEQGGARLGIGASAEHPGGVFGDVRRHVGLGAQHGSGQLHRAGGVGLLSGHDRLARGVARGVLRRGGGQLRGHVGQ